MGSRKGCPNKTRNWDKSYTIDPITGCWLWNRAISGETGYGITWFEGKLQGAHVVFYVMAKGPVPDGLELDHLCRKRSCVNPEHLEPVTRKVNTERGAHCNKDLRSDEQEHRYLSERQIEVLKLLDYGYSTTQAPYIPKNDGDTMWHVLKGLLRKGFVVRHGRYFEAYYSLTEKGKYALQCLMQNSLLANKDGAVTPLEMART